MKADGHGQAMAHRPKERQCIDTNAMGQTNCHTAPAKDEERKASLRLPVGALMTEVTAMIEEGHTVTLPLRGYSMRPFLEDQRDKALLGKIHRLSTGDVVLAKINHDHYVLHRIVAIAGDNIKLRGDGNISCEQCLRSDIKAKAIGFYRRGKTKITSTDGHEWRIYSWTWERLYPIRRYLLFLYRHLHLYTL